MNIINTLKVALNFSKVDFKTRYAGNLIGPLWAFLNPLILFLAYYLIYTYLYRLKDPNISPQEYLLHILIGMSVYLFFSESLLTSTQSLKSNITILKNTSFPAIIFPTKTYFSCLINFGVSLFLVFSYALYINGIFNILYVFLILSLLILFVYGCILPLSLISLGLRDFSQMIVFFNLIVMLVTPIAFTEAQIPESIKEYVFLNPLASYTIALQNIILNQESLSFLEILKMTSLSLTSLLVGSFLFNKGKKLISAHV